jgi:hypothetical protein
MKNRTFICRIKSAAGVWYTIYYNHRDAAQDAEYFTLHTKKGQVNRCTLLYPLFYDITPDSMWTNKQIKRFSRLEYKHDYQTWRDDKFIKNYWRPVIENDDESSQFVMPYDATYRQAQKACAILRRDYKQHFYITKVRSSKVTDNYTQIGYTL